MLCKLFAGLHLRDFHEVVGLHENVEWACFKVLFTSINNMCTLHNLHVHIFDRYIYIYILWHIQTFPKAKGPVLTSRLRMQICTQI